MNARATLGFVLSTLICSWAGDVPAPPEFNPVRETIRRGIEEGRAPSLAVALVRDDEVVWAEGFGHADLERRRAATADSIYLLASVSKPITATALMLLVERGRLDLDAPVNRYLPGAKLRAYRGSAEDITLRRLANHTSGLPTHWNFFYNGVEPPSRDESIRRYGFAYRSPGERVEYCNLAFGIVDYIIGLTAETTWGRFMEKDVFNALRMKHSGARVRPGLERFATVQYAYDVAERPVRVSRYRFDHDGASTLWSSASDLARFLRLYLNEGIVDGQRLLASQTVRAMMQVTGVQSTNRPDQGYGVAWHLTTLLGRPSFSHAGGMPGVATVVRGFPRDRLGYVLLTNGARGGFLSEIARQLHRVLFTDAGPEPPTSPRREPPGESVAGGDPAPFLGDWEGRLVHFDGDIALELEVKPETAPRVRFGTRDAVALERVQFRDGRLTGQLRGTLATQPGYHGPAMLELQLEPGPNGLAGVCVAEAEGYFHLAHWVEFKAKRVESR